MKVAFFIPVIAGRGGIETVLVNLLTQLRNEGDEPRLYIFSGSKNKEWLEKLPWVKEIGRSQSPRPARLFTYFKQALKELRRWQPDAIVCTHPSTLQLARICRVVLRLKNVPLILWLHGPLALHRGFEKALFAADGHICICKERSDEVRSALSRLAPSLNPPICIAYNGTSVAMKYSVAPATIPTFIYIGRLLAGDEKRVADIVQAAAGLKGTFRVVFVGDGPDEEKRKLHQLADQLGVSDKLTWLGWQSEPWATVQQATALILASSYEGFPMVAVEALALGLPVICSTFGANAYELVEQDKTGWIFPTGCYESLTAIMQSLIEGRTATPKPDDIREIGSKFSTENMTASFKSAIELSREWKKNASV